MIGRPPALAAVAVGLLLASAPTASSADPRIDYMLQCQGCHRPDGSGSPGSVPDLRGQLGGFLTVKGGREFLIRVPGSAQSPLSDSELAGVLNWMIDEFDPAAEPGAAIPFTAAEVARHRAPLADVDTVREVLMQRIASRRRGASARGAP